MDKADHLDPEADCARAGLLVPEANRGGHDESAIWWLREV
jgi:hypothetical protein